MGDNNGNNEHDIMVARLAALEASNAQAQQQIAALLARNPLDVQAIGDDNKPHHHYRNRSPIILPALQRNDFELKASLINLAEQQQFFGKSNEHPIEHLERIESIVSTVKINGVPQDYLRCKLFEFSLADKAAAWLKTLPPDSLDGWTAVRNAFLDYFYTKAKTASLRAQIQGFKQDSGESFSEAWERFKSYQRECPHHGFTSVQLLHIFYDGVNHTYRTALNAASNGNFMTRSLNECTNLITNFAESSAEKNPEYDRTITKEVRSIEESALTAIHEKLDRISLDQQRGVLAVEPIYEDDPDFEQQEEISYVNGQPAKQGFNPNYRNHPNLSYRSTNVANPQFQVYPTQANIGTNPVFNSFQDQKPAQQGVYLPPQMRNSAQRPQQQFQGPTFRESLEEMKQQIGQVLTNQLRYDARNEEKFNIIEARIDTLTTHVKQLETQTAQNAEAIKRQPGILPGRPEVNPRQEHVNAVMTSYGGRRQTLDLSAYIDVSDLNSAHSSTNTSPFAETGCTEAPVRRSIFKKATPKEEPNPPFPGEEVYVPKPPYPKEDEEVSDTVEETQIESCKAVSSFDIEQRNDPGEYFIQVYIGDTNFPSAICDSGSSINIMPLMTAQRLGYGKKDYIHQDFTLTMANGMKSEHLGVIYDVPVEVGGTMVPTDFVVIDMKKNMPRYLLLGRPFLATTKAVIDCQKQRIDFHFKMNTVRYYQDGYNLPEWIPNKRSKHLLPNHTRIPPGKDLGDYTIRLSDVKRKKLVVRKLRDWRKIWKKPKSKHLKTMLRFKVISQGEKEEDLYLHALPPNPKDKPPSV